MLLVTWPLVVGRWADAGDGRGPRGRRLYYYWATWPPFVGRWADEGGGRGPRGSGFTPTGDVASFGWPVG